MIAFILPSVSRFGEAKSIFTYANGFPMPMVISFYIKQRNHKLSTLNYKPSTINSQLLQDAPIPDIRTESRTNLSGVFRALHAADATRHAVSSEEDSFAAVHRAFSIFAFLPY